MLSKKYFCCYLLLHIFEKITEMKLLSLSVRQQQRGPLSVCSGGLRAADIDINDCVTGNKHLVTSNILSNE